MTPLHVTAHLYSGFANTDPWSPSLDGILAYWYLKERTDPDLFAIGATTDAMLIPVEGLPLEVVRHGDWWWYAVSSPVYAPAATVRRHQHRRFDEQHERYLDLEGKSGKIQTASGSFKNYRRTIQQHITNQVDWYAVGDQAEVERLLRYATAVGYKTAAGYGRVRRWEVVELDDVDDRAYRHRPLPVGYAAEIAVTGQTMRWGIRPPGRIEANNTLCVMP